MQVQALLNVDFAAEHVHFRALISTSRPRHIVFTSDVKLCKHFSIINAADRLQDASGTQPDYIHRVILVISLTLTHRRRYSIYHLTTFP